MYKSAREGGLTDFSRHYRGEKSVLLFTGTLAHPLTNTGVFQNMAVQNMMALPKGSKRFSADVATTSCRTASGEQVQ